MRKKNSKRMNRSQSAKSLYQQLETRRVLATTAVFAGSTLDINLSAANDVAIVDVDTTGNITINGSDQISVGGSNTTVAASSVAAISSTGTSDSGQELSLVGAMAALTDVDTLAVEMISFQGSYGLGTLDLLDATTVSQGFGSALSVSAQTNIAATGDILLDSPGNDFNVLTANGANISIEDVNGITLGQIDATADLAVTANFIDSAFTTIIVGGNTNLSTVDGVFFDSTFLDTTDLTVDATDDFSEITLDTVTAFGNVSVVGSVITANSSWFVAGDTYIESIAPRDLSGTFVIDLSNADITTDDYEVVSPLAGAVVGDTSVNGDAGIDVVFLEFESNFVGGGNLGSSNAGVATFSVTGDTLISTLGMMDAEFSQIDSTDLVIDSVFSDIILGTATTVLGDLLISAGAGVESSTVNVQGTADVAAVEDILMNLIADGNVQLDAGNDIDLEGLAGDFVTLIATGAIENAAGAVIDIQNNLTIDADSASLGTMLNDSMTAARVTADVQNALEIEQESNVRLLNVSATDLSVVSTGSITNRADATIDVPQDVQLSAKNIVIGQTATDTFNAGRLSFDSPNIVQISENSSTEIFGNNQARLLEMKSDGDITDDPNSVVDIAFSTLFEAVNVNVGDTLTDTFNSRTLAFDSLGHVSVAQDSRVFLKDISNSNQATLSSPVAILDSPTTQVDVAGEVAFEAPYINVGDGVNDSFNAGTVNFGASDRVNFSEDSDTVLSGISDVRQAYIRTVGALSNGVGASFSTVSAELLADSDITLGVEFGDFVDIDRMRFQTGANVVIDQNDSVFLFGNSSAENLRLIADGPIGDSGTASLNTNDHAWFTATAIRLGELATDVFNAGQLTFEATGNVVISESSPMLLSGINTAFNLDLDADGNIEDGAVTETLAQKSVTFTGDDVSVGETGTDCFEISDGPSNLSVNAPSSNIVFGC